MEAFFQIAFSFPTIIYTVFLAVSVLYWFMMIAGVVDLEAFDLDFDADVDADLDADVDAGAFDAAADGGVDGIGPDLDIDADFDGGIDPEVASELDAEIDADVDAGAEGGAESVGTWSALLSFLGLGTVPMMIVVSVFSLTAWIGTFLATSFFLGVEGGSFLFRAAILAAVTVGNVPVAGTVMVPLKMIFSQVSESTKKRGGAGLVGNVVEVTSMEVSESYGRAEHNFEGGGAGVILSVRADEPNDLEKGDRALVMAYDEDDHIYHVQSYDALLSDRGDDEFELPDRQEGDDSEEVELKTMSRDGHEVSENVEQTS